MTGEYTEKGGYRICEGEIDIEFAKDIEFFFLKSVSRQWLISWRRLNELRMSIGQ